MADNETRVNSEADEEVKVQAAAEGAEPKENAKAQPSEEVPAAAPSAEEELAAAKDRYIRLLADFDNMRKRTARELEERTARANERLLTALLPVFDNFEMALSAAPEKDPFADGVRMIATEFRKVLEQSGAEVIDAEGKPFDPMAHEALTMVPDANVPKGEIISQFRKGWKLGGKIIRPAQVIVSAGAPEAPEAPAADAPASEEA